MNKSELLAQAVLAFSAQTGLPLEAVDDGQVLQVALAGQISRFAVEVRSRAGSLLPEHPNREVLISCTARVVVMPHVSGRQAQAFRQAGVGFLDPSGNAYLAAPAAGLFVLIQGLARREDLPPRTRGAAPTLIRLQYAILVAPPLLRVPYRTLAAVVGMSLGPVADAFAEWQRRSLVAAQGGVRSSERVWRQPRADLVRQWVESYGDHLRPKLIQGRYRLPAGTAWEQLRLPPDRAWWGGEPAANLLLDGYLLPEHYTLYTRWGRAQLLRELRLIPDPQGPLTVFEAFEPQELPVARPHPACVYPLLAYADLWLSLDPRNREVAQLLYARYVQD